MGNYENTYKAMEQSKCRLQMLDWHKAQVQCAITEATFLASIAIRDNKQFGYTFKIPCSGDIRYFDNYDEFIYAAQEELAYISDCEFDENQHYYELEGFLRELEYIDGGNE